MGFIYLHSARICLAFKTATTSAVSCEYLIKCRGALKRKKKQRRGKVLRVDLFTQIDVFGWIFWPLLKRRPLKVARRGRIKEGERVVPLKPSKTLVKKRAKSQTV